MGGKKLSLVQLLKKIDPVRRNVCLRLVNDFFQEFEIFPGSLTKHQDWRGGYRDHLEESMNIAATLYPIMNKKRRLPFALADVLFVLFLHDFDKLLRYEKKQNSL